MIANTYSDIYIESCLSRSVHEHFLQNHLHKRPFTDRHASSWFELSQPKITKPFHNLTNRKVWIVAASRMHASTCTHRNWRAVQTPKQVLKHFHINNTKPTFPCFLHSCIVLFLLQIFAVHSWIKPFNVWIWRVVRCFVLHFFFDCTWQRNKLARKAISTKPFYFWNRSCKVDRWKNKKHCTHGTENNTCDKILKTRTSKSR